MYFMYYVIKHLIWIEPISILYTKVCRNIKRHFVEFCSVWLVGQEERSVKEEAEDAYSMQTNFTTALKILYQPLYPTHGFRKMCTRPIM